MNGINFRAYSEASVAATIERASPKPTTESLRIPGEKGCSNTRQFLFRLRSVILHLVFSIFPKGELTPRPLLISNLSRWSTLQFTNVERSPRLPQT